MTLQDLIGVLPFTADIEIIVDSPENTHSTYRIKMCLRDYNFLSKIKNSHYICPCEKYLNREVDKVDTFNIIEGINTIKTVYTISLKKPQIQEKAHTEVLLNKNDIPLNLKVPVGVDIGTSALVRQRDKIFIALRKSSHDFSTMSRVCIPNSVREKFFDTIRTVYGQNTDTYVLYRDSNTEIFDEWDKFITRLYLTQAANYINEHKTTSV